MTATRFWAVGFLLTLCPLGIPLAVAQSDDRLQVGVDFTQSMVWPHADQGHSFDLNAERGDFTARHSVSTAPGIAVHADGRLWQHLTIGGGLGYESSGVDIAVNARLPHPFFFNRPRSVSGNLEDASQHALGVALRVGWQIPLTERFDLHVVGGPMWLRLEYPVVTGVRFTEAFPFNSATFAGASTVSGHAWGAGLMVGSDVGWRWRRHIGMGAGVAFRRVDVDVTSPPDRRVSVDAGRVRVHAGVRLTY